MSNIQALVDALEQINKISFHINEWHEMAEINSIATQALADYHKSQKEEMNSKICKKTGKRCEFICFMTDCFLMDEEKKNLEPSKSNSDVKSLASHSVYDNNSIQPLEDELNDLLITFMSEARDYSERTQSSMQAIINLFMREFLAPSLRSSSPNSIELIVALLSGKELTKDYEIGEGQTFWCEKNNDKYYFWVRGWGSALGKPEDRLFDVINNPSKWRIEKPIPFAGSQTNSIDKK